MAMRSQAWCGRVAYGDRGSQRVWAWSRAVSKMLRAVWLPQRRGCGGAERAVHSVVGGRTNPPRVSRSSAAIQRLCPARFFPPQYLQHIRKPQANPVRPTPILRSITRTSPLNHGESGACSAHAAMATGSNTDTGSRPDPKQASPTDGRYAIPTARTSPTTSIQRPRTRDGSRRPGQIRTL